MSNAKPSNRQRRIQSSRLTTHERSQKAPDLTTRKVLLTSQMAQFGGVSLRRLEEAGFELVEAYHLSARPGGAAHTRETQPRDLDQALKGVWATVAGSELYTRGVLERATDLKVIARCGVGYDAIDVAAASEMGIAVLITPDANFDSVADFTLTLMLGCLRRLIPADQAVRSGEWRPLSLTGDLYGATVGIVGLGRIGRAVARRLQGFNCRILGVEPYPDIAVCAALGIELTALEEMLPQVDVLTVHVPRTSETAKLIGAPELARMKRTAVLVNTARGGIIDEQALVDALRSGALAGAGIDVFEQEPIPDGHPLLHCPNVALTGHVSAFSRLAAQRTMDAVVDGLLAVAGGRLPAGYVNPPGNAQTPSDPPRVGVPQCS